MTRIEKLRNAMSAAGIDGFYVTSPENHRYFSNFNNPDGQLLITMDRAFMFADFRYTEAAKREAADGFEVVMPESGDDRVVKRYAEECGVKALGFEEDVLCYAEYSELKASLSSCELVPAAKLPRDIRVIKEDREVAAMEKAQRIAEKALEELLGVITYGMTETEVAAELEYRMKKLGSDGAAFETIAVSGKNSSSPHGVPRPVKLEKGFLTLDFGAMIDGYKSDMTRTVVIGKADNDMKKLYDTVLKAQCAAIDVIAEGKNNFEMDKIARDIIYAAGYEGCFGHSLGHGVGLLIHESPNLSPRSPKDMTLRCGEVVTVEPGIYVEGKYGCRIEDMVLITPGGSRNLTKAPKELIEI